ncbi:MAG: hypothetical protein SFW67_10885 [Myxococcaceae bacterium]|nr:hypothetical protein [Myxococcaceae bacterium]
MTTLTLLPACPPPPVGRCPPSGGVPAVGLARLVPAGRIPPIPVVIPVNPCGLSEDALTVVATLRGGPLGLTPTVSNVRLDPGQFGLSMMVDVGTLEPGGYLLQVIVDPAVTSMTVPLFVAADRSTEPVERRSLSQNCNTPGITSSGALLCAEPASVRGWRVERPGALPVVWPDAVGVSAVDDVVWVVDRAPDAGFVLRRLIDTDGGLFSTHEAQLDRPFSFLGVSRRRAVGPDSQFLAVPDASVLTRIEGPIGSAGRVVVDDDGAVSLGAEWCDVTTSACFPTPTPSSVVRAVTPTAVWGVATSSSLGFEPLVPTPDTPWDLTAVSRPLGPDAGVVLTLPLPGQTTLERGNLANFPGALLLSTDAGLFAGRWTQGQLVFERIPGVRPEAITPDWVVAQPSRSSVELIRLRR